MARPLIKCVGGKTQLLPQILRHIPEKFGTYLEPFLGGGAVFFALENKKAFSNAVINDLNPELTSLMRVVRDTPEELIELLSSYTFSKETFLALRDLDPNSLTNIQRSARYVYLVRTCFNGLYRVNKSGKFNVSMGKFAKPPTICNATNIREASKALKNVSISNLDYTEVCKNAQPGDVVYLDPPYIPLSPTASFTSYTSKGFNWEDQVKLADTFGDLVSRGVHAILSNSDCSASRELYRDYTIHSVEARRNVNSKGDLRGKVGEIIVTV